MDRKQHAGGDQQQKQQQQQQQQQQQLLQPSPAPSTANNTLSVGAAWGDELRKTSVTYAKLQAQLRQTDLKSVVRKLREDSETFSKSLDRVPNASRKDASQPRKKRWAARVRTGCITCRGRRIKCDETKPICKRCSLTGRSCAYEQEEAASVPSPTPSHSSSSSSGSSSPASPPLPRKALPSPDWHVKEACEYYVTVMIPLHGYHCPGDSAYDSSYQLSKVVNDAFDPESFIMIVLNHQVQCISQSQRQQAKCGVIPALNPIWEKLFRQMTLSVSNLNRYMALAQSMYFVLQRVADLMYIELALAIPTWRAHAEGYGALVKSYGGIPHMFKLKQPPCVSAQFALVVSTMCNTTSPAHDQIRLMSNWSDGDIRLAYSHTGFHSFPCPTILFQAVIRITHLRTLVAASPDVTEVMKLLPMAYEIFGRIQASDSLHWDESYPTTHAFYPKAGEIFRVAVALYAILTLPQPLAAVFTYPPVRDVRDVTDEPYHSPENTTTIASPRDYMWETRLNYRSELYRRFTEALPAAPKPEGLIWPVAVLGVAFSNHEPEQGALRDYLDDQKWVTGADGGAYQLLEKLEEFWKSGRHQWDQCYYEPINIMN